MTRAVPFALFFAIVVAIQLGNGQQRPYYGSPMNMKSMLGCISIDGKLVRRLTKNEMADLEVKKREMEEYEEKLSVTLGNSNIAAVAHARRGPVFPEFCGGLDAYLEFIKTHCECSLFPS